jgi:outer membrane protein TolC
MMPLYTFGKIENLKKMARAGVDVSHAKKRIARNVVHSQVHEAYSALVVSRQYLREIDKAEDYVDQAQKTIKKMEENDSDDYDPTFPLRLKLVRMEARTRRLDAQKTANYARDVLVQLAGLSLEDKVALSEDSIWFSPDVKIPTPERCLEIAVGSRPEFKALNLAVTARTAAVEHAKAQLYPDLALGAFIHFAQTPVAEDQSSPFAYDPYNILTGGGGLVLQWNLDLPKHASDLSQARAEVRKAMAQRKGYGALLKIEVRKVHRAVLETRERAKVARSGAKAARGWVTAKLDLFESGLVPFSEVSNAVKAYFEWRFKSLEASYRARQAEMQLLLSLDLPDHDLGKIPE